MNKINRQLVKSQAQQIIKNKVFMLFILSFVITMIAGGGSGFSAVYNFNDNDINLGHYFDNNHDDYSDDYFENFGSYDNDYNDSYNNENPIDGFEFNSKTEDNAIVKPTANSSENSIKTASIFPLLAGAGGLVSLAMFFLTPLSISLAGAYVSLVRRNANLKFDLGTELSNVFKNTFNNAYWKKLVANLLIGALSVALSLLFIVPGAIFSYSAYFTYQLMNDYPNLKPTEAIKLSRKIVRGNRTELFTYEITFIPWILLVLVTFGLANIYFLPYKSTCDALYYENFRLRALAEGRVCEDDFLSADERFAKYNSMNTENPYQAQQNGYYYSQADMPNMGWQDEQSRQEKFQRAMEQYLANNCTFFTPDFTPIDPFVQYNPYANQYGNPQQPPSGGYYYNPQQPPYQGGEQQQPQYTPYYAQPPVPPQQNVQPENNTYAQPEDNAPQQTAAPSYYDPPQDADTFSENDNN